VDARLQLAQLTALQNRWQEASRWFARAREMLDQQEARQLRALTDYDEGWMHLRRGERSLAEPLFADALTQFRAIGMTGWIRRAEALWKAA
jgi:hypothetical protein